MIKSPSIQLTLRLKPHDAVFRRQTNFLFNDKHMTTQTLLIELLTEELPPKALNNLGNHFAASVAEGLEKAQLIDGAAEYTAYASPRRFGRSSQKRESRSSRSKNRKKKARP